MRKPGDVVAQRYEIVERIAAGGMGAVFRARHRVTQGEVALKLMLPHVALEPRAATRFKREASVAAEIGHEGIVRVIDAGVDEDGALFLVMELLQGESLRARLCRVEATRGEALALIDALLDPLAAAHARGFVHRDLKPENVFVTTEGRVKILDFGIARHVAHESATMTGTAIGTPHYMAPEQAISAKGATPASDVWAVGVMLYEILAGHPPFQGPTPHAVVVRACVEPHLAIGTLAPHVGPRRWSMPRSRRTPGSDRKTQPCSAPRCARRSPTIPTRPRSRSRSARRPRRPTRRAPTARRSSRRRHPRAAESARGGRSRIPASRSACLPAGARARRRSRTSPRCSSRTRRSPIPRRRSCASRSRSSTATRAPTPTSASRTSRASRTCCARRTRIWAACPRSRSRRRSTRSIRGRAT